MLKEASKQRLHRVETTMEGEMPPDLLLLINAELARQDATWGDQRGNGEGNEG